MHLNVPGVQESKTHAGGGAYYAEVWQLHLSWKTHVIGLVDVA